MPRATTIQWTHLGNGARVAQTQHFTGRMVRAARDKVTGLATYECTITAGRNTPQVLETETVYGLRDAIAWLKHNLRRLEEAKTIATNSRPNPLPGREVRP